jgi:serine protease Do
MVMDSAVNPSRSASITTGSAFGSVTDWLRQITVRIVASKDSHGSGVIWRIEGLIVTNAHVTGSSAHEIELADGRRLQGWLLARDRKLDLAALAISASDLPGVSVRSARTLRLGEVVIAVGNPFGGIGAVSAGIVHRAVGHLPWLVSDIRLAPGNSGGPLSDSQGNVVGINSMIVGNLGWAVTSDAVQSFLHKVRLAEVD